MFFCMGPKKHYICKFKRGGRPPALQRKNVVYLKDLLRIALVSVGVVSCGNENYKPLAPEPSDTPVEVVLAMGNGSRTRTVYDADDKNFVWQTGDKIAVWAKNQAGAYSLDGQTFSLLAKGLDRSNAYFTATLQTPMEEGTYSYYMTYPLPESVNGTAVQFKVPEVQDGAASGGVDIIVAEPVSGPALSPIVEASPIMPDNVLNVKMKHMLHFLRFYIPEGWNILGEPVTRIEFAMPQAVAGTVSVDVSDASTAKLGGGVDGMTLELKDPIDESADGTKSAVAGIFPPQTAYSAGDQMNVAIYSENKWASINPMSLDGRVFAAGHVTPVPLKPVEARQLYKLRFTLASNNLGEDPYNIKLSLPEGVNWPGSTSNELGFDGTHGGLIKVGDTFIMETKDEAAFRALSSQPLTVNYESESALVTETLSIGDLASASNATCSLNCPYLLFEDFSGVESFNSDDEYKTSSAGSKSPHVFLNGWSAARAGAQAGTAIRIACRREFLANDYTARADSPFLSGLKNEKTVNLDVEYDYSMDRAGTPKIYQTVYFGYITTSANLKSGDATGTFPNSFELNETTGSYTNINHTANASLLDVKAPLRLSWRTVTEANYGMNNNTCWLYLDNIKVKIKK